MGKKIWKKQQLITARYYDRCNEREIVMMTATMNLVGYFIMNDTSGDDEATKKTNAEMKVGQLSTEVALLLYPYRLGNTQPLKDAINDSELSFMDANAKASIISSLTA